ncbi:Smg9 protein [Nymphaea thermarum]|nr:Smg9 protein [Nymphaea thermarum]
MGATTDSTGGSGVPAPAPPPKILLAKPGGGAGGGGSIVKIGRGDEEPYARSRLPPGSLSFVSDSWEVHPDRLLPFMSDNSEFTVIGIIGPPGVGKSTILNELYGYDSSTTGMLPPFPIETEETRTMARHCTVGIELRVTSERLILLDTQPVFSPSVLAEMMRPDGSSAVTVLTGESLSAEMAHELMNIQLGVFLASICNVLLVVSEGLDDVKMWHLMLTVDLLKQGIPDPSMMPSAIGHPQGPSPAQEKEERENFQESVEFMADLVFVHSKLRDQELCPNNIMLLRQMLSQYFDTSSFRTEGSEPLRTKSEDETKMHNDSLEAEMRKSEQNGLVKNLFFLPCKVHEDSQKGQYESYSSMLGKLRDQVLTMRGRPFGKPMSERDWLRNSARIWEKVKKSPVIADYSKLLLTSGMFRK